MSAANAHDKTMALEVLDSIVVERPSVTPTANQHVCMGIRAMTMRIAVKRLPSVARSPISSAEAGNNRLRRKYGMTHFLSMNKSQ